MTECPEHPGTRLIDDSCTNCAWHDQPGTVPPETFGHEPVQLMRDGWGYAPPACARCTERRRDHRGRLVYRPQPWPCMSAVVLGLVTREEAQR